MTGRELGERLVLAGAAFALGFAAGQRLRDSGGLRERLRRARFGADAAETVTYGENLPDSLGRREPAPEQRPTRFGGTGGLGVSPAAGGAVPTDD